MSIETDSASPCHCGSTVAYSACCGPYISGQRRAPTAETLMRSRYTAYAREEVDYILHTQAPESRKPSLEREVLRFAQTADFLGLTIEHTDGGEAGAPRGTVEFTARYEVDGHKHVMRERSHFRYDAEEGWYYVNGSAAPSRSAGKVGRNAPCPCGSGKKYKRCCGP